MLKSINLPQGMLQANVVERIQQTQQQNPDMQQRYFEIALAKEQKRAEETVKDSQKIEHLRVGREDASKEGKHSFSDSGEKDPSRGDGYEDGVPDEEAGNTINVRV